MIRSLPQHLFRVFIFLVISIFTTHSSWSCSVCGCGDPLASAGSARPLAGSWRISFEHIYLTASAQSDDLTGSIESIRQVNLNTTLSYNPTDDLTLTAMFPMVEKYWSYTASPVALSRGGGNDEGTPFGIGDIMVGARYFFWQETDMKAMQHQALAISGGVYLPSGGTNFTSLITGNNLDTHAQLGTDAIGFYGGILFNKVWDDFSLNINFNVVARTKALTNDPNSPIYDYTFGTSYTGGLQGQLQVADDFAFSGAVEGRYAITDTELSMTDMTNLVNTPNTGGTVLDATPGVWWNVSGDTTLYAKIQIPFYTDLTGSQFVGPTYILGTQFLIK